jgi:sulfonate transport system substrate-binding protein
MTDRNNTSVVISSQLLNTTRRQWLAGTAASALALASGGLHAQQGNGTAGGQRVLRVGHQKAGCRFSRIAARWKSA